MNDRCKEMKVSDGGRWPSFHQCYRKPWKDGYCKTHHPESIKARQEKAQKKYEAKRKLEPWYRLNIANERLKFLYEKQMLAFVKPIMTYEQWIQNIDTEAEIDA